MDEYGDEDLYRYGREHGYGRENGYGYGFEDGNPLVLLLADPGNPADVIPSGITNVQAQLFISIYERVKAQLESIICHEGMWDSGWWEFGNNVALAENTMRQTSTTLKNLVNGTNDKGLDESLAVAEEVFALEYMAHYFRSLEVLLDTDIPLAQRLAQSEEIYRFGLACETAFLTNSYLIDAYESRTKGSMASSLALQRKYEPLMQYVDRWVDELTKSKSRSILNLVMLVQTKINDLSRDHDVMIGLRNGDINENNRNTNYVSRNRLRTRISNRIKQKGSGNQTGD